jgi:hypothetical protein
MAILSSTATGQTARFDRVADSATEGDRQEQGAAHRLAQKLK